MGRLQPWARSHLKEQAVITTAEDHFVITTTLKFSLTPGKWTTVFAIWLVPLDTSVGQTVYLWMVEASPGASRTMPCMILDRPSDVQDLRHFCDCRLLST